MDTFYHLLNRKLKRGSHPFPGKDGETCVIEAAIVAADFPYQPARAVETMPTCLSRPICRFVCADTAKAKWEREVYTPST
ncbi:hypothetical protein [Microvirga roseola]|uniref:hypothetical protein n=1 Tax=Microvirga roseola TaxID=2883126 RepID=UPI001E45F592|nr:hypothetical protein [Microvirga roseola]